MLLSILYVKIFFGGSRIQIGAVQIELDNIINSLKYLVVDSLGIIPSYLHIGIIIVTLIFIIIPNNKKMRERLIECIKYLFIVFSSILICMMPVLTASGLELEPRMCMAYGCTIGISLLFMYKNIYKENDPKINEDTEVTISTKIKKYILYINIFIIFVLTSLLYNTLTMQHIEINKIDKEIATKVEKIISNYEKETGLKVTKIAGTFDLNVKKYEKGFIPTRAYNQRSTSDWSLRETIIYYTKRKMLLTGISFEQYIEFFDLKDWDEFSEEQVVIKGDTIYFCAY